jgi:hypothetical protein
MTIKHATDNQIQEFSLNNISDTAIVEHIKGCKQCSEKAAHYKMMFAGIKQQHAPVFNFSVTQLVMGQLTAKPAKQPVDRYFIHCGIGAAACMLAVLLYLIKAYLPQLFSGLTPLFIGLVAISVISLFVVMDMYLKFKAKMNALNFSR